jgi:protein TonB
MADPALTQSVHMSFSRKRAFKFLTLFPLIVTLALPQVSLAEGPEYDVRPTPLKTPPPDYPPGLKRDGVAGVVVVKVLIDETGAVAECKVSKSTNSEFDQPALEAVKKWKFKPALKDGAPVKAKLAIPIQFRVEE